MPAGYVARIQSLSILSAGASAHQDESLGRRASYIVVGSQMIRENPILGSGPGTFPLHYAPTGYAKAFSANRKLGTCIAGPITPTWKSSAKSASRAG